MHEAHMPSAHLKPMPGCASANGAESSDDEQVSEDEKREAVNSPSDGSEGRLDHQADVANEEFTPPTNETRKRRRCDILDDLPPVVNWRAGLKYLADTEEPPVILIDMDNTLCDWEGQFKRLMSKYHPQIPIVPPDHRREFKIELNYDESYRKSICELTSLDNFWLSMDPTEGAVEALQEMVALGLVVFIVTTPDIEYTARSAHEKIEWIERHLGAAWKPKLIISSEKTLVKGDILIDDKPGASFGVLRPTWTHLIFAQPYNNYRSDCPILRKWSAWGPNVYQTLVQRERLKRHALAEVCGSPDWVARVTRVTDLPRQRGFRPFNSAGNTCCCGPCRAYLGGMQEQ